MCSLHGARLRRLLGVLGLAGARSSRAVLTQGAVILGLGFCLQLVRADGSGYFLVWFFVLVSIYPVALAPRPGRLVPILAPAAYPALLPWGAVDVPHQVASLRALTLMLDGAFVYAIAAAFRATSTEVLRSQASALEALTALRTALLPPRIASIPTSPSPPGYKAAGILDQVGGDWYDTIPHRPGAWPSSSGTWRDMT